MALTAIVSLPAVPSVSDSEASVASTSVSDPLIVTLVLVLPVTFAAPEAVTFRIPTVSLTIAVKVSGAPVLPVSETLTPAIAAALPTPTV